MNEPDPSGSFPPASLSNTRLTLLVAGGLFALAAWPLLLVDLPPMQDLPNHVATAHIVAHPDLYPEFAFNGLFKSNSLLTLWFYLFGGHGLFGAARAFAALVLAMNAVALPVFVLHFAGRRAVLPAALFVWPMMHSFSYAMGFLNFSFAFGLSLILLVVIDGQRQRPNLARGLAMAALSVALWYTHPFPLAVVGVLVALHVATRPTWRQRIQSGIELLLPLALAGGLAVVTAQHHLVKAGQSTTRAAGTFSYDNPWEMIRNLWSEMSGALTAWGSMTIVPAVLFPIFAWKQRRLARPFFSIPGMALLAAAYVGLPEMMSNWNYLNTRLIPFLWAGLALRLPNALPRPVAIVLVACALSFSAATGIDYVRLDRDRAEITAGIDAVPEHATLLPLLFKHKKTSTYTASLTHAWAYYTVAKSTSAPLVFGVERSYPITYREFPPASLIPPALDRTAELCGTPDNACKFFGQFALDAACTDIWSDFWSAFWHDAEPRFSHLLTWAMPPEARPMIPRRYRRVFAAGDLEIYARDAVTPAAPAPHQ